MLLLIFLHVLYAASRVLTILFTALADILKHYLRK